MRGYNDVTYFLARWSNYNPSQGGRLLDIFLNIVIVRGRAHLEGPRAGRYIKDEWVGMTRKEVLE